MFCINSFSGNNTVIFFSSLVRGLFFLCFFGKREFRCIAVIPVYPESVSISVSAVTWVLDSLNILKSCFLPLQKLRQMIFSVFLSIISYVFNVCLFFFLSSIFSVAFYGCFCCVNQNDFIFCITFQQLFSSRQRKCPIFYQCVFYPFYTLVNIAFYYSIACYNMYIRPVFTPVFQSRQQLIFYAQLRFSSSPSVLFFSISTIFLNVGLFTPVILRNCFSSYSFIISYFIMLLLYHIPFIFERGLVY